MRPRILLAAALLLLLLLASACGPRPSAVDSPEPTRATAPAQGSALLLPTASPARTPFVVLTPALPPVCAGKPTPAGTVIDPCRTVIGVVRAIGAGSFMVEPDYGQEQALGLTDLVQNSGRIRVDLGSGGAAPRLGEHVSAIGPLMTLVDGAHALAPAYRIDVVVAPPPSVPEGVLAARRVWAEARSAWPLIAPAIIEEGDPNGTAAAALYPDGIARVFIHTGEVPDAHTIWHEAGHIYHASVLRAHRHSAALFTPEDEVGTTYWSTRGLPGTWAQSLSTGAWATTGYEVLAETFAAVNLGDAERASTSGVPLDRARMRFFFARLGG